MLKLSEKKQNRPQNSTDLLNKETQKTERRPKGSLSRENRPYTF